MNQQKIAVSVSKIERLSPNIKMFEFTAKDTLLSTFRAGSHVTVHMDEVGIRRAYSLISDPERRALPHFGAAG
ncbi:FAD-binding oxidoreductase [Oceanimonas sp. NS1]|nr:FAD-binding oxidoreductase [Oceanimonas sp. NS1]